MCVDSFDSTIFSNLPPHLLYPLRLHIQVNDMTGRGSIRQFLFDLLATDQLLDAWFDGLFSFFLLISLLEIGGLRVVIFISEAVDIDEYLSDEGTSFVFHLFD